MTTARAGDRSRWQFSMRTLVLLPVYSIVLALGVFVLLGGLGGAARGIGHTSLTLRFVALDSATRSPIRAAVVSLYHADIRQVAERAETSALGEAGITQGFPFVFSEGTPFRADQSLVRFDSLCFEVSAPGYKPARYWLSQFTGRSHDLQRSTSPPVARVTLDRLETR